MKKGIYVKSNEALFNRCIERISEYEALCRNLASNVQNTVYVDSNQASRHLADFLQKRCQLDNDLMDLYQDINSYIFLQCKAETNNMKGGEVVE